MKVIRLYLFENMNSNECLKKNITCSKQNLLLQAYIIKNWLSSFPCSIVKTQKYFDMGIQDQEKVHFTLLCLHDFRFISDDLVLMNENQKYMIINGYMLKESS